MSYVKNGFTSAGNQRLKNTKTGKSLVLTTSRFSDKMKLIAVFMYLNGMPFRGVGSTIGVSYTSVMNWFSEEAKIHHKSCKTALRYGK